MTLMHRRLDCADPVSTSVTADEVLSAVDRIQQLWLRGSSRDECLNEALQSLLAMTESGTALITESTTETGSHRLVSVLAQSHPAWASREPAWSEAAHEESGESSWRSWCETVCRSTRPVIAPSAQDHANTGSDGETGHASLQAPKPPARAGLPLHANGTVYGAIILSGRNGGYRLEDLDRLMPLATTCALLMHSFRTCADPKDAEKESTHAEVRQVRQELREQKERLQAIIQSVPECVKVISENLRLLEINAAGLAIIEADSPGQVLGQSILPLLEPEYRETYAAFHRQVCAGWSRTIQFEIVNLKGNRRWLESHAVPLHLGPDRQIAQLSVTRDITAERQAAETIAQQQAHLMHSSRLAALGQMVAAITHEVSQPLAAISNFAAACSLAVSQPVPDMVRLRQFVEAIMQQSLRAGQILDRIRSFVKRVEPQRLPCDLRDIIEESLQLMEADLRHRQVRVETQICPAESPVLADRVQIQQVLVNLITNACEAMERLPRTERRLWIRCERDDAESIMRVEVQDNGPGLDPACALRLFEAFQTSRPEGLGMGLAICRDIVTEHHGTIRAVESPGRGMRFQFELPLLSGAVP